MTTPAADAGADEDAGPGQAGEERCGGPSLAARPAWHAARELLLRRLQTLAATLRSSDDPDADQALADLAPLIRLLAQTADDLPAMQAVVRQLASVPAWLDLAQLAPAWTGPVHDAAQALRAEWQAQPSHPGEPWRAAAAFTAGHRPDRLSKQR